MELNQNVEIQRSSIEDMEFILRYNKRSDEKVADLAMTYAIVQFAHVTAGF